VPDSTHDSEPLRAASPDPGTVPTVTVDGPSTSLNGSVGPTHEDVTGGHSTGDFDARTQHAEARIAGLRGLPKLDRLNGYEILEEVGAGGMGVVYKARQPALNRMVALKMVLAGARATAAQLTRFRGEAMAVAKLDHPNIVKVFDIGEHDGLPFFAMEYVDGGALSAKVRREPLDPREAAALAETIARAMDYAHARGVIHRDLKPANVLLAAKTAAHSSGSSDRRSVSRSTTRLEAHASPDDRFRVADWEPKVTDFGLAKQVEDDTDHVTRTGAVMGTPGYMAPEQATGQTKDATHLADVYGLGACLYEFLTGRPPFSGPSVVAVLTQVRSNDPVSPSQLAPGLPKDLETICLKCLQKEPARRYATAGELADDLRRYLDGQPIRARPVGTVEKMVRWARRKPREAALWFAAIALAVTAVIAVSVGYVRAELLNKEITRQKHEIEQANANLTATNTQLTDERDTAEHVQGFFADEWRRMSRDVVHRLPGTFGKDREEFAAYLSKSVDRLNRLTGEGTAMAGRMKFAAKIMTGDTLMSRRLLGRVTDLNDVQAAVAAYTEAEAIGQSLVDAEPASDLARGNLAVVKARLGTARLALGERSAAKRDIDSALALREDIVRSPRDTTSRIRIYPADAKLSLADSFAQRARWYETATKQTDPELPPEAAAEARAKDLNAARDLRVKALAQAEADAKSFDSEWLTLSRFKDAAAESYLIEAADAAAAGKPGDAQRRLNEALKLSGRSIADAAADLPHKSAVASLLFRSGVAYLTANQPAAAGEWFDRMRSVAEAIIRDGTGPDEENQFRLYQADYGLGTVAQILGRRAEATARFKECVKLTDDLVRDNPRPKHVWAQMIALARAGYPDRAVAVTREEQSRVDDPASGKFRVPPEFYFNAACAYSLAAHAVGRWSDDAKLKPDESRQRAAYLAEAWKAVEQSIRLHGSQAKDIDTDPDLAFLQSQPGFKEKLAGLRGK
jgi:serine/threonine protein kinase